MAGSTVRRILDFVSSMRAHAEKSPAVRFFTTHSFDDQPDIRAATMRTLLDHLALGESAPTEPISAIVSIS